jgi:hypothetical protein
MENSCLTNSFTLHEICQECIYDVSQGLGVLKILSSILLYVMFLKAWMMQYFVVSSITESLNILRIYLYKFIICSYSTYINLKSDLLI